MSDLAIYDMDRTVTRRATYTPFLIHCAVRRDRIQLEKVAAAGRSGPDPDEGVPLGAERLAERAQVITITHLPQIASVADTHYRVEKVPGEEKTDNNSASYTVDFA